MRMTVIARVQNQIFGPPLEIDPRWEVGPVPANVSIRANRWLPVVGGWFAGMRGPAAAVTVGRMVLVNPSVRLTRQLLQHELAHVRQWNEDRLFPLRYVLEWIRHGYWNNRYEQEARAAEIHSDYISLDQ